MYGLEMIYTNIAKQKLLLVKLTIFNPIFEYIIILNIFFKNISTIISS